MAYSEGYEYDCKNCGETQVLTYRRVDEPKFCDNSCQSEYQNNYHEVTCAFCGEEKTVTHSEYERNDNFFCSRSCFSEYQKTRIEVECEVCGSVEWVTPTRAKSYRTCSRECLNEIQSDEFSDEGNPNFQYDIDEEALASDYEDGKSLPELAEELGMTHENVANRLEKLGVERRAVGYPKEVETSFGLMVRSRYERDVAEALRDKGIDFEYEPSFPGPYIPDFVLSDETVIEVWGVVGDEYQERRKLKEDWYRTNGYNIIGIEPDDIPNQVMKVVMENKK